MKFESIQRYLFEGSVLKDDDAGNSNPNPKTNNPEPYEILTTVCSLLSDL